MSGSPSVSASAATENAPSQRVEEALRRIGRSVAGRWTLTKLVGVGGMASVYEAKHRNGRTAAVKVLHPHVLSHPTARRRFLSEGYAANKVEHPGVVLILDDGEDGELLFLVMELLRGRSLAERVMNEGPLPINDVVKASSVLLDVLAAAHDKGVVHRDIKPSNVFELESGEIKVLDFGVARVRDPDSGGVTDSGVTVGTPAFMAPEQAMGRLDEVDAVTDVWAVGATMFQLLTGRLVHEATSPNALIVAAATKSAPPVKSLRPDVPDDIARTIDRALAFRREDRWPNARAMLRALLEGAAVRGMVELASAATAPEMKATKRPSSGKRAFFAVVILAVLAIAGASYWALGRTPNDASVSRQPPTRAPATHPASPTPTVEAAAPEVATATAAAPAIASVTPEASAAASPSKPLAATPSNATTPPPTTARPTKRAPGKRDADLIETRQ